MTAISQLNPSSPDQKISPRQATVHKTLTQRRVEATLHDPRFVTGAAILLFWILIALFGPILHNYRYDDMIGSPWQTPSLANWLGTDRMGRDLFTRIAEGARMMLVLPTVSVMVGVLVGATVGLFTGYYGGLVDDIVMRVMDILMAFPMLMLYLLIIFAIGPSPVNVVWAIAIGITPGIARLVRGLSLDMRSREFILAAQMRGETGLYIMFREILPNIAGPVLVDACIRVAYAMFATSSLGYLGLGVPPPYPDWGSMISDGRTWIFQVPWAPIPPIIAVSTLVIALNLIADGLRKAGWVE